MGWKGTIRSFGAAVRAAERDARRRQRELEIQKRHYEKMQELQRAAYEVAAYENHIDLIRSVHKECNDPIDWKKILASPEPQKPAITKKHEDAARSKAINYKPGLLDTVFKREEIRRKKLQADIEMAIKKDSDMHRLSIAEWEKALLEWRTKVKLAHALLSGDKSAKLSTIKDLDPFSEISTLGSNLSISILDGGVVEATIRIHGTKIVPNEVRSLLKNGRLSKKKMPKTQFNEIYQDYVCSCVLRVANELFSAIPDDIVVVTALDKVLNTKTGHLEDSPILSACISRSTLHSLNMNRIDPSDSMDNFIHNMSFKKTKGFDAVSRVEPCT